LILGLYANYIFPRLLDWVLSSGECRALRDEALASSAGNTLEIGFGTALNIRHYPETVTKLTVIDNERMLPDRVARRMARARFPVETMQFDASGRLPFEDHSFDTVVSTWTLCSIESLSSALAEIHRVLKPEGRFIFLEHGRSDDEQVARKQDFWNPIQKIVGRGCNMNRPVDKLIREAGFKIVTLDRFLMRDSPRLLGEMYRGIAQVQ